MRSTFAGTALAVASAGSYGVTIACNRELATRGFGPGATLPVRFSIAGALALGALALLGRPLLPAPGERWRALSLGLVGYAVEAVLFYSALEHGTAAAVALLFYSYPAMVAVVDLVITRTRPSARVVAALVLSSVGAVLIVAGGDVTIEPIGVVFALLAAASFTVYLLASSRVVPRTDSMTNGAWVAIGAAIAITSFGALGGGGGLRSPGSSWWLMLLNGVATAIAFVMLFAALKRLGASRTAIVMTMEALSAVVLGALVLGEPLGPRQLIGGASILAATVLISSARPAPVDVPS